MAITDKSTLKPTLTNKHSLRTPMYQAYVILNDFQEHFQGPWFFSRTVPVFKTTIHDLRASTMYHFSQKYAQIY